jgi:hypothetical protein
MHTSAAAWAHVTLYYASFFAASALLGIFGCYVGYKSVVEVSKVLPGSQEIAFDPDVMNKLSVPKKAGPHEQFWFVFYACSPSLIPLVIDRTLITALHPIQGNKTWQIDARNKINYDSYRSIDMMLKFQANFDPANFPSCLNGELPTQLWAANRMTGLVFDFAKQVNLSTDALRSFAGARSRGDKIDQLILRQGLPNVVSTIDWTKFL